MLITYISITRFFQVQCFMKCLHVIELHFWGMCFWGMCFWGMCFWGVWFWGMCTILCFLGQPTGLFPSGFHIEYLVCLLPFSLYAHAISIYSSVSSISCVTCNTVLMLVFLIPSFQLSPLRACISEPASLLHHFVTSTAYFGSGLMETLDKISEFVFASFC